MDRLVGFQLLTARKVNKNSKKYQSKTNKDINFLRAIEKKRDKAKNKTK